MHLVGSIGICLFAISRPPRISLSQLKEETKLDERGKLRAALRKLREKQESKPETNQTGASAQSSERGPSRQLERKAPTERKVSTAEKRVERRVSSAETKVQRRVSAGVKVEERQTTTKAKTEDRRVLTTDKGGVKETRRVSSTTRQEVRQVSSVDKSGVKPQGFHPASKTAPQAPPRRASRTQPKTQPDKACTSQPAKTADKTIQEERFITEEEVHLIIQPNDATKTKVEDTTNGVTSVQSSGLDSLPEGSSSSSTSMMRGSSNGIGAHGQDTQPITAEVTTVVMEAPAAQLGHVTVLTNVDEESDDDEIGEVLPTKRELEEKLKLLESKLDASRDFDERREFRAAIRLVRTDIREKKYCEDPPVSPETSEPPPLPGTPPPPPIPASEDGTGEPETVTSEAVSHAQNRTTSQELSPSQPNGMDVKVKKEENGAVTCTSSIPLNQGQGDLKVTLLRRRTESNSAVEQKDTTVRHKRRSDSGTEYTQENTISTRKKVSERGSAIFETTASISRRAKTLSGSEYEEIDVFEETEEDSVSKGQKTSHAREIHMIRESNAEDVKIAKVDLTIQDGNSTDENCNEEKLKKLSVSSDEAHSSESSDSCTSTETSEALFPEIVEPLSDCEVLDGESVTLKCRIKPIEGATVSWYRGRRLIMEGKDFKQAFDGTLATLTITEVFPDDEGEFRCCVKALNGQAETVATVKVKENENLKLPEILSPLRDVSVTVGQKVELVCQVCGHPPPAITWYHEKHQVKEIPDVMRVIYYAGLARLIIEEGTKDTNGQYTCVAKNASGEASSTCQVTVAAKTTEVSLPPRFITQPKNLVVSDGDPATFVCKISGLPQPQVTWYKERQKLGHDLAVSQSFARGEARLEIRQVMPEDAGMYKCVAANSCGQIKCTAMLTVQGPTEPPEFIEPLTDDAACDGKPFCLSCRLHKSRGVTVSWYRSGKLLRGVDYKQSLEEDVARLEIREMFPEDEGVYECIAKNGIGETKTFCRISVEEMEIGSLAAVPQKTFGGSPIGSPHGSPSKVSLLREKLMAGFEANANKMFDRPKPALRRSQSERMSPARSFVSKPVTPSPLAMESSPLSSPLSRSEHSSPRPSPVRRSLSERAPEPISIAGVDVATCEDEGVLYKLLETASGFEERRRIRLRLKELRKKFEGDTGTSSDREDSRFQSSRIERDQRGGLMTTTTSFNTRNTPDGVTSIKESTREVRRVHSFNSYSPTRNFHTPSAVSPFGSPQHSPKRGAIYSLQNSPQHTPQSSPSKPNPSPPVKEPLHDSSPGSMLSVLPLANIRRNATAIKEQILAFCKENTTEYENVEIRNFGSSWSDGMAFCALVHHFCPESFDYHALDPNDRRRNFELAFEVAEKHADIAQLLEVDDMVRMRVPDWKCVFTYVQQFYRKFRYDERNLARKDTDPPPSPKKVLVISRDDD